MYLSSTLIPITDVAAETGEALSDGQILVVVMSSDPLNTAT